MVGPRYRYMKIYRFPDKVKVGDYVYYLHRDDTNNNFVVKRLTVKIIQHVKDYKKGVYEDKDCTLSDGTVYLMSDIIDHTESIDSYRWQHYNIFDDYRYTDTEYKRLIFTTKELAYNFIYQLAEDKINRYKNELLSINRKIKIWEGKLNVYKKYKDIKK